MTRRVALVSGHFAPSNLVGAHRARLWSRYLPDFGWEPIIVTGDPKEYEERLDPDLERLIAPGLRVIHAPTISTRPIRLVGDVGVRAFWGCYRTLARLAKREIDFVLVTSSNFLAPVGRLVTAATVPFGIDYQDPGSIAGRASTSRSRAPGLPSRRRHVGAVGGARCRADHRHGAGLCRGHAGTQSGGC